MVAAFYSANPKRRQGAKCFLRASVLCLTCAGYFFAAGVEAHEGDQAEIHTETGIEDHADALALNVALVGSIQLEAPLDPASRKFFTTTDLYVAGDYAYMGSDNNRMHIIDISQPEAMRAIAQVQMPGPALDIKVDGNLAVVAVQGAENTKMGVVVVDISDPHRPRILADFFNQFWFGVHNLYLYRNRAYLAHSANRGITVLNLTDPTRPFISGSWRNDTAGFGSIIHDVFIRDGLAFLSDKMPGLGGLVILDLADPDSPVTLSSLPIAEGLHNAWKEGDYVYCNQEFGGWAQPLHIVDVSDPRNPVESSVFTVVPPVEEPVLGPHNTWVEDDLLYWAFNGGGLRILDVSDPVRPVEIGYYTTPSAWGAQPHTDGLIYLADSHESALMAFRFEAPSHKVHQASLSTSTALAGTDARIGVEAMVVPRNKAGRIQRVSARLLPDTAGKEWTLTQDGASEAGRFAGQVTLPRDAPSGYYNMEIRVEDEQGLVYPYRDLPLALYPSVDLQILDERLLPGMRVQLERTATTPTFTDLGPVKRGGLAAAFEVQTESTIGWDIHMDFARPVELLGYEKLSLAFHPGNATGQALVMYLDEYRFGLVGRRSSRILRLDLNHKEWQVVEIPIDILRVDRAISTVRFAGDLQGTFYLDDFRLVPEKTNATALVEEPAQTLPQQVALEQNYPNPFNGETAIRFALPAAADATLDIFNLAGQKVATLAQGRRTGGVHTLAWDGRDGKGHMLASGIYLYRLQAGGQTETRKLLLMR